ncbi:unnamed protein product, partial [Ilex paraguariensis]
MAFRRLLGMSVGTINRMVRRGSTTILFQKIKPHVNGSSVKFSIEACGSMVKEGWSCCVGHG